MRVMQKPYKKRYFPIFKNAIFVLKKWIHLNWPENQFR
jgi:hypothetical protein